MPRERFTALGNGLKGKFLSEENCGNSSFVSCNAEQNFSTRTQTSTSCQFY